MFSAVLTDGETPGWLPWKAVINNLGGCSIRINTLPGLSPRAQEPRTVPSLHTSLTSVPSRDLTLQASACPMRWQANQCPSSVQPHPSQPFLFASFPFSSPHIHCCCKCHRLFLWVVSLSPAPIIVLLSISQHCLHSGDFCFESLQRKLMWPWRECLCLSDLKRKENALWKSSFMSLIDRRLPEWLFLTVITKIRMGLNASSLGEWKWSSPGERKTGPLARLRGLSLMLLAWHGELTLTESFIQTHTKSPGTGGLRDNYI